MNALIQNLEYYTETWANPKYGIVDVLKQQEVAGRYLDLVKSTPLCLDRKTIPGHITASVLVLTADWKKVLLTLHGKLQMWLQLGGHADGDSDLAGVARRECLEESGLDNIEFVSLDYFGIKNKSDVPVDLDIHWIPARKSEAGHYHYDARFLATTTTPEKIQISDESKELRWFDLDDAYALTTEWSMHRQFEKAKWFRSTQSV